MDEFGQHYGAGAGASFYSQPPPPPNQQQGGQGQQQNQQAGAGGGVPVPYQQFPAGSYGASGAAWARAQPPPGGAPSPYGRAHDAAMLMGAGGGAEGYGDAAQHHQQHADAAAAVYQQQHGADPHAAQYGAWGAAQEDTVAAAAAAAGVAIQTPGAKAKGGRKGRGRRSTDSAAAATPAGTPGTATTPGLDAAGTPGGEGTPGGATPLGKNRARSAAFESRLEELRQYKEQHGDCRVPWQWKPNPSLASWCDNQRRQWKLKNEGKNSSMTPEREASLNELGFWWGIGRRIATWEERYKQLVEYKEKHGTANIVLDRKKSDVADYSYVKTLKEWSRHQNKAYQEGSLSQARLLKLQQLGLELTKEKKTTDWNGYYDQLLQYKGKFGHCNVKADDGDEKEYKELATWVERQRLNHGKRKSKGDGHGSMRPEHYDKLKALDFKFTIWDVHYETLKQYKADHGNTNVPKDYPDKQFVNWLKRQRVHYELWKDDKQTPAGEPSPMTNERLAKLIKVGYNFNPPHRKIANEDNQLIENSMWLSKFNELKAFKKHFGHANVPKGFDLNKDLGKWVTKQRLEYRNLQGNKPTKMTDERVKSLSELGFQFDKEEARWDEMFLKLQEFRKSCGSTDVPKLYAEDPGLARWVHHQRTAYKQQKEEDDTAKSPGGESGKLSADQIAKLKNIGFNWESFEDLLDDLVAYKEEFGSTDVPAKYAPNQALAHWVIQQRMQFKRKRDSKPSTLSSSRLAKLEGIGFDWKVRSKASVLTKLKSKLNPKGKKRKSTRAASASPKKRKKTSDTPDKGPPKKRGRPTSAKKKAAGKAASSPKKTGRPKAVAAKKKKAAAKRKISKGQSRSSKRSAKKAAEDDADAEEPAEEKESPVKEEETDGEAKEGADKASEEASKASTKNEAAEDKAKDDAPATTADDAAENGETKEAPAEEASKSQEKSGDDAKESSTAVV